MKVSDILTDKGREVLTIDAGATLIEAAQSLDTNRIGALVVLDADGSLAGVISERDIVRIAARNGSAALTSPVSVAMTRDVHTASPGDSLDDLMIEMTDRRIRHLPVIDGGQLAGMVSIGDVVKRKIESAEAEADAMKRYISAG
ncbi:CBS domain-containing protein [Hyphobacterium marinum]|uniref:CBS domain-containing protein n=1 Tax=Hyphobacterium marinum TaxID=3116574 RepID=A0ABU7LZT9_9PROT|nr:CBS domain-containing protein [Hyphobacterium sp. Y6023]MEE2567087.1 CBS domain-containing protein [Hyphobacterium sp. Y6023]